MGYDVVVIGAGAAGLTVSIGLAKTGKRVLLVERKKIGGECTWGGCVPSKSFISASKVYKDSTEVFKAVRERVEKVYLHETPEIIRSYGIDLVVGEAKFVSSEKILVGEKEYSGKRFVISTGSRSFIPPIKGLENVEYLTNDNFFDQKNLPKSMAIVGGGVISLELAFPMKQLGTEVTILEMADKLLPLEDPEVGDFYREKLKEYGINLVLQCGELEVEKQEESIKISHAKGVLSIEKILISTGRVPNLEKLNLESAGVEYDRKGIKVNEHLLTTQGNIYAAGDAVGPYRFSHIAGYHGEVIVRNILFPLLKKKIDYSSVPWTIFAAPEYSRTGMNEAAAREKEKNIRVYYLDGKDVERSIISMEKNFRLKVICDSSFEILGASCIGERAGEIIGLLQYMKSKNRPFYDLVDSIQSYPTYIDALRNLAKQAYVQHLKEMLPFSE